jgi:hypothetical protein
VDNEEYDFYAKMIADLPCRFKGKAKIEGLIYALSQQLNAVQRFFIQLKNLRTLKTAAGKQLDNIGEIVDFSRANAQSIELKYGNRREMTDDVYSDYLKFKIFANTSVCTYSDILSAMRLFWSESPLVYSESLDKPAAISIYTQLDYVPPELSKLFMIPILNVRPAGVELQLNVKVTPPKLQANINTTTYLQTYLTEKIN